MKRAFLSIGAARGRVLLALVALACAGPGAARAAEPSTAAQRTIVKADRLEMKNNGEESHFVFLGHVRITGTNLEITCERVEVFAVSKPDSAPDAPPDRASNIRRMLATGNVTIAQAGQKATCGTAEVLPGEDVIILTEDPVVTDVAKNITVRGTRMKAHRDRDIEIENPEVVGPALPNFGPPAPAPAAPAATAPAP